MITWLISYDYIVINFEIGNRLIDIQRKFIFY